METETLERNPGPGPTPEALERLFREFSRTSREMEHSHAELQARVEALQGELAEKDLRLEQKKRLEALGLMVAGVAHEFRNPLGSLSLYLDCLGDVARRLAVPESREALDLIARIESGVRHLDAIVEDMLIFTRPGNPSGERCDLPRLLEEALLLVKSDVDAAGVRCLIRVDPVLEALEGGPVVQGDRDQTVRIFVNVLKNAVQAVAGFRPRGTGVVEALVRPLFPPPAPGRRRDPALRRGRGAPRSSRRPSGPDSIEVAILDNGPGVAPERMERLFVPFYTEKQGGIGLGLYIVHSLMERQGGRVDLENRTEGGLLVRLLFAASGAAGDVPGTSGAGGASLGEDAASMAAAEVRRPSNG